MATTGKSAAGAELVKKQVAHAGPAKETATEEHAGSEAARLVTLRKRKRDIEDDGCETESSGNARPQQVERRPSSPTPASLQVLVDVCRYEFDGSTSTPPTAAVARVIRGLMDKIKPDDVGLSEELRFHEMNITGNPPIITCKTIFQCKNYEIAVLFLPQGTVMPLHDHPGMTVFSKLLMGSAHIEGYDCIRHPRVFSGPGSSILAEKVPDHDVTEESGAWVLFPDGAGGNMRRFVAGEQTHCAFLDILTPPYSPAEQRSCTFYKDILYEPCRCAWRSGLMEARRQGGKLAWLQKIARARRLHIVNLPYGGPTIF